MLSGLWPLGCGGLALVFPTHDDETVMNGPPESSGLHGERVCLALVAVAGFGVGVEEGNSGVAACAFTWARSTALRAAWWRLRRGAFSQGFGLGCDVVGPLALGVGVDLCWWCSPLMTMKPS